jgi:hypothetical protein
VAEPSASGPIEVAPFDAEVEGSEVEEPPSMPEPPPVEDEPAAEPELDGATVVAGGARLIAKHEDGSEMEYNLGLKATTIGRAPGNVIEVAGESVSRRHAEVALASGGYTIRDLETRNGTWVNGQRIAEDHTLRDGDLVQIGTVVLVFKDT